MRYLRSPSTKGGKASLARLRKPELAVEFSSRSDRGRRQAFSHGYLGHVKLTTPTRCHTHGWLFALADGLQAAASKAAVEDLLSGFRAALPEEPLAPLLVRLVQEANQYVYEIGKRDSWRVSPTATTIVACAVRHDRAVIAHVGDSRCYLIREGQTKLLTRDHIVAEDQAPRGILLSRKEIEKSPNCRVLSRCLGKDLFVKVETSEHKVLPGDVLMLCCYGFYRSVSASELAAVAGRGGDLNAAARQLVALAYVRDGGEDISVQLIRIQSVETYS
jgi:serine/threonine protein phosphatase PrpC